MTCGESLAYIHSIPKFRRPLGNVALSRLLDAVGNPQDKLKFIHIAGTNGKGSTAAMLGKILECEGYKTGLFTSPFIEVFNERIQINSEMISDDDLCLYTQRLKTLMEETGAYVSEFAFITAMAFLYFYEKHCDCVVLETGMGGRLDATNIIKNPILCVITSIGLDHTQYLGNTIEEIAEEKAGIIKRGAEVVSYPNDKVRDIIISAAAKNGSKVTLASYPAAEGNGFIYNGEKYTLSLRGDYQKNNAAVVLECVKVLNRQGMRISDKSVKRGLSSTKWQVRYEFVGDNLIIDGSHNPDGMSALVRNLKAENKKIYAVTAMMADKNTEECMRLLAGCAAKIFCCEIDMPRCEKADTLAKYIVKYGADAEVIPKINEAVRKALGAAGDAGLAVVCGSLYLAGEVKKEIARGHGYRKMTRG